MVFLSTEKSAEQVKLAEQSKLYHKNATSHSCFLLPGIHSKPHAHNWLGHARMFTAVEDQIRGFW